MARSTRVIAPLYPWELKLLSTAELHQIPLFRTHFAALVDGAGLRFENVTSSAMSRQGLFSTHHVHNNLGRHNIFKYPPCKTRLFNESACHVYAMQIDKGECSTQGNSSSCIHRKPAVEQIKSMQAPEIPIWSFSGAQKLHWAASEEFSLL